MESFALIIFGITSNLASGKLIPALYDMEAKGLLPSEMIIVGNARRALSASDFEHFLQQSIANNRKAVNAEAVARLAKRCSYLAGNVDDSQFYTQLKDFLAHDPHSQVPCDNHIFYLATYPELYGTIFEHLQSANLNKKSRGWVRLMIEKPFGHDYQSAYALNQLLARYFTEDQIYRLDHYLGKETLQNILTFRFGNGVFEPLMYKEHIDHIQITAAEDFGIGKRGGYYDKTGALRDVGQNHLLQMLAFATMDAPSEFTNAAVTHERLRVFKNLVPLSKNLVLGQYADYQQEENVEQNSTADTFFAFKTELNNDRFLGVPIYIRGGKKLEQTATEISVVFKVPLNRLFKQMEGGNEPNVLIYRIQPNEAIVLKILTKKPGKEAELESTYMQFCYRHLDPDLPEPYENLLLDAIRGNQTFFTDAEEVEAQWQFIDALRTNNPNPHTYEPGSWGPDEANDLIQRDGREWLEPSMAFCQIP